MSNTTEFHSALEEAEKAFDKFDRKLDRFSAAFSGAIAAATLMVTLAVAFGHIQPLWALAIPVYIWAAWLNWPKAD